VPAHDYSAIQPKTRAFLEALDAQEEPPIYTLSYREARAKAGGESRLPILMYFHGGGWVLGNRDTHDRSIREIADGAHAAVVFVNYTPSPEARYPTAIEEAYAATRYLAENGESMGLDPSRLAVCFRRFSSPPRTMSCATRERRTRTS